VLVVGLSHSRASYKTVLVVGLSYSCALVQPAMRVWEQ
jgi:hypothetical protein